MAVDPSGKSVLPSSNGNAEAPKEPRKEPSSEEKLLTAISSDAQSPKPESRLPDSGLSPKVSSKESAVSMEESKRKQRKKKRRSSKSSDEKSSDEERKRGRRSRRKRNKSNKEYGESLEECSDTDWQSADPAYNSELINLKKKANKVTVFSAPHSLKPHKNKSKNASSPRPATTPPSAPPPPVATRNEEVTDLTNLEITVDPAAQVNQDKLLEAKADAIGKLVAGVVRMYLKDRRKDAVELEVRLHTKDGVNIDVTHAVSSQNDGPVDKIPK
ncbi:hypothetical protein L596_008475 [Steinernema carpocapsae]|uniref:Uncharacterized protein n=1 Tax=Steinernema carpocapsae TaxID=34508 RepID=A0A4U5PCL3_STECR|nr:hypothetical protein L596_008475 [Steinernema carpocapsae]